MSIGTGSWAARGAAALVVLAAVSGCAGASSGAGATATAAPAGSGSASVEPASGALSNYYGAIADHDAATARRYLSPEYAQSFGTPAAFDAWVANYVSLRDLGVRAPQTPAADIAGAYPNYRDLVLYEISYQAVLAQQSANEVTGPMDRFVLLGRASASSPWLILSIDTSP